MQGYYDIVVNSGNDPVVGASVFVYDSTGALATIYQSTAPISEIVKTSNGTPYYLSQELVATQVNPITTDSEGRYIFFAENGIYTVVITANGYNSKTLTVTLFDADTQPNPSYAVAVTPPNDGVNVSVVGANVATTNGDLALVPKGTGALLAQVPDNAATGGDKRGAYAVDWQTSRIAAAQVASGSYSVIVGGNQNTSSGLASAVLGGASNLASNSYASIGGGLANAAAGEYSTIAGGRDCIAAGNYGSVSGGQNNIASAIYGTVGGGRDNFNSGQYTVIDGGRLNTASNSYAVIGGGYSHSLAGDFATISGGSTNQALRGYTTIGGGVGNIATGASSTDYYATVAGGSSNNASAKSSTIGGGEQNAVSGILSTIAGGAYNNISATFSAIAGGIYNTVSGSQASIIGGANNTANAKNSTVVGGNYGTTRGIIGYAVFPSHDNPIATALGVSQGGLLILGRQTTNNSSLRLRSNALVGSTDNQLILADNSAVYFRGSVIANVTGGGNTKSWTFDGQIKRGSGAASTVLTGSTVTSPYGDAGASGWSVSLAADTTNGGLAINVVGDVSATVRWVCRLETTEVTY